MLIAELPASVSTAANTQDLCSAIVTGTGYLGERIGNSIELVGVSIDGCLVGGQSNNVADDKYNEFRIMVADGTPALAPLWAPTVESMLGPRVNPGLKRVLYDRSICLASPGPDSVGYMPPVLNVSFFIPLSGTVDFTGSAANLQTSRSIVVAMVSDSSIAPSPGFSNGKYMLFYIDK